MPFRIPLRRKRGRYFSRMATSDAASAASGNASPPAGRRRSRVVELQDDDNLAEVGTPATDDAFPFIPPLFTKPPPIKDGLMTETAELQDATVEECVQLLAEPEGDLNLHGVSTLARAKHVKFLKMQIAGPFPKGFVALDASRPWMLYWALTGLYLLGEDVSVYKEQVIGTLAPFQNGTGGFGGGHGQFSHIATTYASVLSLVTVGGREALDLIDRKALWHWLGRMKQPDGGFSMVEGGEVDIRGAYCSMVIIALLDLPLELPPDAPAKVIGDETFLTNLEDWLARCQTYEGGIAGAPDNEAHGAYAFCGLACLSIIDAPSRSLAGNLNMHSLISCLSSLQHAPEPGFAGRTNKLVDGCYSWWVGGCWSLIAAALGQQMSDLWSREGLARYILCCCQNLRSGGLRDKPSKGPDGYHSCYVLAGLSAAQHVYAFQDQEKLELVKGTAGFGWTVAGRAEGLPVEEQDRVRAIHPVFVIPFERVEECRNYFEEKAGF
ncbi:uncharacterized protein PV09_06197 [Verruconis gallopava]|uniref:Protein farnesyltransferase subunit beta n=1 Tax=Verruconis gallopava TaxID=253628 RepID=A0A0D2A708_9PEZI|nr:uncharacterized protein PV09_06197 [Verruconis gallopava]KIW02375.1 hypothetical protein PV09_06197 [Verruconis gallopava]